MWLITYWEQLLHDCDTKCPGIMWITIVLTRLPPKEQKTPIGDPNDEVYAPTPGSGGRYIRDEQTVNVFILALLSSITATTVPFDTRWVAERNAMVFRKNVWYIARTDGHLQNRKHRSLSLIEVKPRKRENDISIRIQESAQMAAWISQEKIDSHDPNKTCEYVTVDCK